MGLFDSLFKNPAQPVAEIYVPASEYEAWLAVMIGVMTADGEISDIENELMSRQLIFKTFFQGVNIVYHYKRVHLVKNKFGSKALIQEGSKYISDEYKATLFSMVAEMIVVDGAVTENEVKILEFTAKCLDLPIELSQKIIEVMNIRYYKNCIVVNDSEDFDDD